MSWLEALILGIVQGLTEFLPVSSSGHLEIGQALLGSTSSDNLTFAILVHVATVCSTLVVLWQEVAWILKGCFTTTKWNNEKDYAAKILVSMIPIFIVGMFFKDQVEAFFGSGLTLVGICLLVTALLLAVSYFYGLKHQETESSEDSEPAGASITYLKAFVVGIAQSIAVLPGLSRSGSTIATGLLCGVKKKDIAQFSFIMVIIPILGEALLDALKIVKTGSLDTNLGFVPAIVGFVAAFLTGCFACKFMINIVKRGKLIYFAIYCLIVGILAICLA
ncbi:MAG: undecaprenyl-diphosphate phosphatase [Paludibacteraceae bacterium]|nr:undecaprenyl-diphosphate phosphatase [Paludibacteraceae bacterium]